MIGQTLGWACIVAAFLCAVALGMVIEENKAEYLGARWMTVALIALLIASGELLTR